MPVADDSQSVDLSGLMAMLGDDSAAVAEVLAAFQSSASQARSALQMAQDRGDMKSVADGAHKLKSAAYAVGAERLGRLCSAMETHAQSDDFATVEELMSRFQSELSAVLRYLETR